MPGICRMRSLMSAVPCVSPAVVPVAVVAARAGAAPAPASVPMHITSAGSHLRAVRMFPPHGFAKVAANLPKGAGGTPEFTRERRDAGGPHRLRGPLGHAVYA